MIKCFGGVSVRPRSPYLRKNGYARTSSGAKVYHGNNVMSFRVIKVTKVTMIREGF